MLGLISCYSIGHISSLKRLAPLFLRELLEVLLVLRALLLDPLYKLLLCRVVLCSHLFSLLSHLPILCVGRIHSSIQKHEH